MYPISAALMVGDAQKGSLPIREPDGLRCWWHELGPLFAELILVVPDPLAFLEWESLIIVGHYRQEAPLCAVRAALQVAQNEQVLAIDPDESMLSTQVLDKLAAGAQLRWDVVALQSASGAPILPVVFHKRCLKIMDRHLAQATYSMDAFLQQVRLHTVDINTLVP